MQNEDKANKGRKSNFGTFTAPTLRGHYKPLSEFDQNVLNFIVKNLTFSAKAYEEDIKSVNKIQTRLRPSYNQIATLLNEKGFKTSRGNKWSGRTVSRFMKKSGCDENKKIEQEKQWENSKRIRVTKYNEFVLWMRDEVLPTINQNQKNYKIAQELNKKGITTRNGAQWSNGAVCRLYKRIKELSEE